LQDIFDSFIDSYIDDQVGIANNFLSIALAKHLKANLLALFDQELLKAAGTGNDALAAQNKSVRGDAIYWLDRAHEDQYENEFFDLMDAFVLRLNQTCYTGITGYEFHYTRYAEGAFYGKHKDQFRNDDSRQYSMVMYLNEGWVQEDGGELCIHHVGHQQNISPVNGTSVFFKSSELEHEVLCTNKPRLSITGWLKKD
jgi:SM-20-related protein